MLRPPLTPEIITAAIQGFEQQKLVIDTRIAELRAVLAGAPQEPVPSSDSPKTPTRKKMSAAARKRISEAQRKRWSDRSGQSVSQPTSAQAPTSKPKRTLSAAGKAAIVAALKKRWAAKKADTGQAKPVSSKKSAAKN
jgi:hypothetical protein